MCHAPMDVPRRPGESPACLSGSTVGETILFTGRRRCCIGPMTSRPANRLRYVLFEHNRLLRSGCWPGLTYRCGMFCWWDRRAAPRTALVTSMRVRLHPLDRCFARSRAAAGSERGQYASQTQPELIGRKLVFLAGSASGKPENHALHRLQVTSHQQAESVGTEFRLTEPIHEMPPQPQREERTPGRAGARAGQPRPLPAARRRLAVLFTSQNVTI
jgi:hypothetical protein